jgi:serine/threonine-protein kinase
MDRKRLKSSALVAVGLFFLFGLLNYLNAGWFQKLETPLYDVGASLRVKRAGQAGPEVVLIEWDREGSDASGSGRRSREEIGQAVALLSRGKAKVIGIDLPLGGADANQALKDLRQIQEKVRDYGRGRQRDCVPNWLEEELGRLESRMDGSAGLATQMTRAGNTVVALAASNGQAEKSRQEEPGADGPLKKNFVDGRDTNDPLFHGFQPAGDLDLPATGLREAAMGMGHKLPTLKPGLPGRAHPALVNYERHLLPSFPLRIAMAYLDIPPREVLVGANDLLIGNKRVPLHEAHVLIPPLTSSNAMPRLSCSELLAGKSIPGTFEGKIALIGLQPPMAPATMALPDPSEHAAWVVQSILREVWIERPGSAAYIELAALFVVLLLGAVFSSLKGQSVKVFTLSGLALASLACGVAVLFAAGLWVKTAHMATAVVVLSLLVGIRSLFAVPGLKRELEETHKLLGLHYRRQGELDQAFEEFRKCRPDPELRELLYDLGREYERNAMLTQALRSYETLRKMGRHKDVDERIVKLGAPGKPLPFENGETAGERAVLSDSFVRMNRAVGRYQIVSELGKGTMGVVYKAKDPKINRFVAVKVIRFSDDFDEEVLQEVKSRFLREAEIAGQLSHPSIITIFDAGEDQDLTYMAMECLEGRSLSHYCRKESLLPLPRAVEIVENIAGALDHAHKASVIHRDIKPANIMILQDGGVKVTDFGIAKAVSSSLTKTGIVLGTPNYMSPEQIMGHKIGPATDIFSLGVLFFNLVTGELPFRGEKLNTLLFQITQARHPSVRSINPSLPRAVEQIIDKALAKNPDHRFKSAGEMAKYLGILRDKIDRVVQAGSGPVPGSAQKTN